MQEAARSISAMTAPTRRIEYYSGGRPARQTRAGRHPEYRRAVAILP